MSAAVKLMKQQLVFVCLVVLIENHTSPRQNRNRNQARPVS